MFFDPATTALDRLAVLLQYGILAGYACLLLAVAGYGLHRYLLVYLYCRHRHNVHAPGDMASLAILPRVTVQLPMFNEPLVAERVIDAACRIDWPADRLEIQVLDDSTREFAQIARRAVEKWARRGVNISYLRRTNRIGYKAGALEAGLAKAGGEFIAIFDADFIPPPDVLRNVIGHFLDAGVGMVQIRWEHLNRDASPLTGAQAIFLDGHFAVEHAARNRSGRFMHFNGTAGVWRRAAIVEAGGWQHDTLTEDLDLSYRAQLAGWRFVFRPDLAAPAELPPHMLAFRQQAHRWTKGSFQTAIKLLPRILRRRSLPVRVRSEAFFHLTNVLVYPLMLLVTLLMFPVLLLAETPLARHPLASGLLGTALFLLATGSAGTFFCFAQWELHGRRAAWRTVLRLPLLMALGIGLCLNNTRAIFEAVVTSRRVRRGDTNVSNEFVRTPKYGATGRFTGFALAPGAHPQRAAMLPILEVACGLYLACFAATSLYLGYARGSVPFLVLFAAGYLYVGIGTLRILWRMNRQASPAAPEPAEPAPSPA